MGLLPDFGSPDTNFRATGGVKYAWTEPADASMSPPTCFCGMRKSSMFVDLPCGHRSADQFTALAAWLAFSSRFET
jgi:hypothetical protein